MVGVEGDYANTTPHHDFIEFSVKTPERITENYAEFYRSGLSLNDISELTGTARSTIRDAFNSNQNQEANHQR